MLLLFQGKGRQGHNHNDHYSTSNIPSRKVREHHTRLHTHHHHPNIPLNRSTQPKLLTIQIRLLKPTPGSMMEQDLDKVTILEGKSSNERPPPRKKSRLFFGLRIRGRKKKTRLQVLPFAHQVSSRRGVTCWRALPPRPAARC
jgi:hypothetical protein